MIVHWNVFCLKGQKVNWILFLDAMFETTSFFKIILPSTAVFVVQRHVLRGQRGTM